MPAYQRSSERYKLEAPVMLEDFYTGFDYKGIMNNYSADGAYLESDYAPRPGRKAYIKFDGLSDVFTRKVYVAEIRWRRPLPEKASHFSYGVGVRFC